MPLQPPGIANQLLRSHPQRQRCLGPPDVYPQDPNQKEDELSLHHVKQGFAQTHASLVPEEYASLAFKTDLGLPATQRILSDLKGIQEKKEEANTLPDTGRKRQIINARDNFWLVTGKNKAAADNWLKELATGTSVDAKGRSIFTILARRVPIFNKKEEVLMSLCEHNVPVTRGVWLIKMTAAYALAMSETSKTKKRQAFDPAMEWTHTFVKFLKEQLSELAKLISNQASNSMMMEDTKPENSQPYKLWQYCLDVCEYMYNEGLLDRQEFLQSILEMFEKYRDPNDPIIRILMPVILQYTKEFTNSEVLSRKLAYQCAKRIAILVNETDAICHPHNNHTSIVATNPAGPQSENQLSTNQVSQTGGMVGSNMHPVMAAFLEIMNDAYLRFIIFGLSAVVQTITTDCPSALVWHYFGEGKSPTSLLGSPLDYLPRFVITYHHSDKNQVSVYVFFPHQYK